MSKVVKAFIAAATAQVNAGTAKALHEEAARCGDYPEREVAARLLTASAGALWQALDRGDKRPQRITSGETAFAELEPVTGLALSGRLEQGRRELVEALKLAAARLGPFPGGQPGQVRHPGERMPPIVESVEPSAADLEAIARHAGAALGHIASHSAEVDPVTSLRQVI